MVQAWENGEGSFATLAVRFMVGEASVNRWVSRKRHTGSVEPERMGGNRRSRLVDDAGDEFLRAALRDTSDSTLVELCEAYLDEFDVDVSPQTMSDTVRRLGLTRKRGSSARELPSGPNS